MVSQIYCECTTKFKDDFVKYCWKKKITQAELLRALVEKEMYGVVKDGT